MRREFHLVEGSSNKFWAIELKDRAFTVHFGRIGTAGQAQEKSFASAELAYKEYDKLVAEKTKKGYREVGAGEVIATPEPRLDHQPLTRPRSLPFDRELALRRLEAALKPVSEWRNRFETADWEAAGLLDQLDQNEARFWSRALETLAGASSRAVFLTVAKTIDFSEPVSPEELLMLRKNLSWRQIPNFEKLLAVAVELEHLGATSAAAGPAQKLKLDLPHFRYHPSPIATGAIVRSGEECECCGAARGYKYTGPVYCGDEVETVCPWCIADGTLADKFEASLADDRPLRSAGLPETIVNEVSTRTPGYTSWQQESWMSCCGDACEFHGDAPRLD